MAAIDIINYDNRPDAGTLTRRAAFVVTDYPIESDEALLQYGAELKIGVPDVGKAFSGTPPPVDLVQKMDRPMLDPFHNVMLSTTDSNFPLHTDEYFADEPARFVLLLCVTPAESGGTTLIANVDDIVADLAPATLAALMKPIYPTQLGLRAVLTETDQRYTVRYNALEMVRTQGGGRFKIQLSPEAMSAVAELRKAAEKNLRRYDLKRGDCLVIHNGRTLHGRTAFSGNARRLMKRVRIK